MFELDYILNRIKITVNKEELEQIKKELNKLEISIDNKLELLTRTELIDSIKSSINNIFDAGYRLKINGTIIDSKDLITTYNTADNIDNKLIVMIVGDTDKEDTSCE